MNKSELLQKLSEKFYKVGTANLRQPCEGSLKWYLVKVYDLVGDALRDMSLGFCVENEGEVNEVAYWLSSEPKPTPVTSFTKEVNDYIKSVIDAKQIEGGFVELVDEVKEIAVVKVVMNDLTQQRRFVDKDENGDLQHRQLV